MPHADFIEIIHQYLLKYPSEYISVVALLLMCIIPCVSLTVGIVYADKTKEEGLWILGLVVGVLIMAVTVFGGVGEKITNILYPSFNTQLINKEMAFVKKCHESQCLMAPGEDGGLGMGSDEMLNHKVRHFILNLPTFDTSYGYQFVSGTNVLQNSAYSYGIRFQSVSMKEGHAMLFVEIESDHKKDGSSTEKGIYEVPLYVALHNLRETRIISPVNEIRHEREAAYQNSVGQ